MSDIPRARQVIAEVMQMTGVEAQAKLKLGLALVLMRREPTAIIADGEETAPEMVAPEVIANVRLLATHTRMTYGKIADHVGLPIGRIAEIVIGGAADGCG